MLPHFGIEMVRKTTLVTLCTYVLSALEVLVDSEYVWLQWLKILLCSIKTTQICDIVIRFANIQYWYQWSECYESTTDTWRGYKVSKLKLAQGWTLCSAHQADYINIIVYLREAAITEHLFPPPPSQSIHYKAKIIKSRRMRSLINDP